MCHVLLMVLLVHIQIVVVLQQIHLINVKFRRVQAQHGFGRFVQVVRFVLVMVHRCLFARAVVVYAMRWTLVVLSRHLLLLVFEALLPSEVAAVFEHVAGVGVQAPEGAFARFVWCSRHFYEAVVEGK